MRLFVTVFLHLLFVVLLVQATDCPPNEEKVERLAEPLKEKFNKDICGQGIKPGGAADLVWVRKNIFPKYLTKAFLGKDLPRGFMNDLNSLIDKCHKNTYNYCARADRDAMGKCAKDQASSLAAKYALQIPGYCPYLDKIMTDRPTKHEKGIFALFTNYCNTKGKKC